MRELLFFEAPVGLFGSRGAGFVNAFAAADSAARPEKGLDTFPPPAPMPSASPARPENVPDTISHSGPHRFYGGVDLHARSMYLCILDPAGQTADPATRPEKTARMKTPGFSSPLNVRPLTFLAIDALEGTSTPLLRAHFCRFARKNFGFLPVFVKVPT